MVVAQVAHRKPQVLLRGGAEDLGRDALAVLALEGEVQPRAPDAILSTADGETDGDDLAVEPDGRQIVQQRFRRPFGHRPDMGQRHRMLLPGTPRPAPPAARRWGVRTRTNVRKASEFEAI